VRRLRVRVQSLAIMYTRGQCSNTHGGVSRSRTHPPLPFSFLQLQSLTALHAIALYLSLDYLS